MIVSRYLKENLPSFLFKVLLICHLEFLDAFLGKKISYLNLLIFWLVNYSDISKILLMIQHDILFARKQKRISSGNLLLKPKG